MNYKTKILRNIFPSLNGDPTALRKKKKKKEKHFSFKITRLWNINATIVSHASLSRSFVIFCFSISYDLAQV